MKEFGSLLIRITRFSHNICYALIDFLLTSVSVSRILFSSTQSINYNETSFVFIQPHIIQKQLWVIVTTCAEETLTNMDHKDFIANIGKYLNISKAHWINYRKSTFLENLFQIFGGDDSTLISILNSLFNIYHHL